MYLTNLEDHVNFFVDNLGSNVQCPHVQHDKGCCLTFGGGRFHRNRWPIGVFWYLYLSSGHLDATVSVVVVSYFAVMHAGMCGV